MNPSPDAIVVGAGPNGLAAAITLARAGLSVLVLEASDHAGGGIRSEALTLPGFIHDSCSSIYPLGVASPFFRSLKQRIEWIYPEFEVAHPLDHGRLARVKRSIGETAKHLGSDAAAYEDLMTPLVARWEALVEEILQPLLRVPGKPGVLLPFGVKALRSALGFCRRHFKEEPAKALFGGMAAHSCLSLDAPASAAMGLVLAVLAHGVGWPMAKGGAGRVAAALVAELEGHGGQIETSHRVSNVDQLPPARAVFFDVSAKQLLAIAGHRFSAHYRSALGRFRLGPGAFKIDYALSAPIPWTAPECRTAGTVHVGGSLAEIQESEEAVATGRIADRPFVLVAQHSVFDSTRAPAGNHTAWAYCHVPNGSNEDMTHRIESQVERFAPGFRDCILARAIRNPRLLEEKNSNLVGGDINGGLASLRQLIARPIASFNPYRTSVKGWYLCSASTPPGGGVHGMCGYNAARHALKSVFGLPG